MEPDPVATRDQQVAAMRDVAAGLHALYRALREEGFGRRDALELTRSYLADLTRNASGDG